MTGSGVNLRPAAEPEAYRLWLPRRAIFTAAAAEQPHGQRILDRLNRYGIPVEFLTGNRLNGLRGADERETYRLSKSTLAVVTSPPSAAQLRPIPPSADWQFHLAEGCPAHCQYCYLAGSLSGPPVVRVFADLDRILGGLQRYETPGAITSYEASCYTDPLGIEHLTGSLSAAIEYFGTRPDAGLRWVTKFDAVEPLLSLAHRGRTRCRFSLNAATVSRTLEAGTASMAQRLRALQTLAAEAGYPVGLVIAPIMPIEDWREHYSAMFELASEFIEPSFDLTVELITHRFTPGSKEVLRSWYPRSGLEMEESSRTQKRNRFGSFKYVYPKEIMGVMRKWFETEIERRFGSGRILYWT